MNIILLWYVEVSCIYVIKELGISHKEQTDRYSELKNKISEKSEGSVLVSVYWLYDLG